MNRRNTAIVASVAVAVMALGAGAYWVAAGSSEPSDGPAPTTVAVRPDVSVKTPTDAPKPKVHRRVKEPGEKPTVRRRPDSKKGDRKPQNKRRGPRRGQPKRVEKDKIPDGC